MDKINRSVIVFEINRFVYSLYYCLIVKLLQSCSSFMTEQIRPINDSQCDSHNIVYTFKFQIIFYQNVNGINFKFLVDFYYSFTVLNMVP